MPTRNVTIEPPELLERAARIAAAEGKTVDELTAEALRRDLARRTLDRFGRLGAERRRGMTDEQVDGVVAHAIRGARG